MSGAKLPPAVLTGPVVVNPPLAPSSSVPTVTVIQPNATGAIAVLVKAQNILGEIIQVNDAFTNPVWSVGTAGGAGSAFGDPVKVYPGGDVFNPSFVILNNDTTFPVSANAGGFQ